MKNKITILGVYGQGNEFTTGQAVKCIELIDWLTKYYGEDKINVVNTYNWKKNPFDLIYQLYKSFFISNDIVILPAQNGIRLFGPIIHFLNIFFNSSIHYLVVGGWLPEMLQKKIFLRKLISSFTGVYVELPSMVSKLRVLGLDNVYYLPNVRNLENIETHDQLERKNVCVYSRITETKGIEDAILIINKINAIKNVDIKLDIYGKIDSQFEERFNELLQANSSLIEYKGVKKSDEGIDTVSKYKALIFPTYYEGEGLAGTILDAFGSGTPVIANDWKYNKEIINSGIDGFIYPYRDIDTATNQLESILCNEKLANQMSSSARKRAEEYMPENVYPRLIKKFKGI